MTKKILFTGGHHSSALVVAKRLRSLGHQVFWAGHKFARQGDKSVSAEFQEVTAAGIPFFELKTGKFYGIKNPFEYFKIFLGFLQAFSYLLLTKPDLIVSFGGYLAVPMVIAGWFLRIPAVTHEQTVTAGWANKAITPFVKKIFLTHRSSLLNYPTRKSVVTGLPLRPGLISTKKYRKPKPNLIYITCGKQGSHVINHNFFPLVPQLVKKYRVVHQTGALTLSRDQDKARRLKNSLPADLQARYLHQSYFFDHEATRFLKTASLVISRSGAHITYELLLLNKRAVVIPIPWVSHQEQLKNALLLQKLGRAVVLEEKDLIPETLRQAIDQALKLKPKSHRPSPVITDATDRIITELTPFLNGSSSPAAA